jgi:hypothetical protein
MINNGGSRNNGGSSSNGHVNGGQHQQEQPAGTMIRVESDRVQYTEQAIVSDYMYVVLAKCGPKESSVCYKYSLLLYNCSLLTVSLRLFLANAVANAARQIPNDHCGRIRGETSRAPTQVSHRASSSQGTLRVVVMYKSVGGERNP